jgi:osmoprotectant transport system permease protein
MVDNQLILAGAIPAAALALLADFTLGLAGSYVTRDPLRRMRVAGVAALLIGVMAAGVLLAGSRNAPGARPIVIGSKNFTEQTILGELLAQRLERAGFRVDRRFYLAGTLICHEALSAGEIDMYVEYSGTAYTAILKRKPITDGDQVLRELREEYPRDFGVRLMAPLGFNNTFAIMIRGEEARRLNLKTLSEAAPHTAQWRAAFGHEFIERADGYQGLADTYGFRFAQSPTVMDLGLTYRALADNQTDMIAGDATNGLIAALDLAVLADDKHYFPPYHAVPFVRADALRDNPGLAEAIDSLGGALSDDAMRELNYAVDGEHKDVKQVVADWLDMLAEAGKLQ